MTRTEIIEAIRRRAVNDATRSISGLMLRHKEADDLGGEAMDWLRTRLGLSVRETDAGVEVGPRKPGRPHGSVRKPQAGQVGVRLTVDERQWLRARAEADGTTEAGLIRRLIAEARRV